MEKSENFETLTFNHSFFYDLHQYFVLGDRIVVHVEL